MKKEAVFTPFRSWLHRKFLEWQLSRGQASTISQFAAWLGVARPTLSAWMGGTREPVGALVDQLAEKLADPEVYDILGLRRPDPLLKRLIDLYDALPEEVREQIVDTMEGWARQNEYIAS